MYYCWQIHVSTVYLCAVWYICVCNVMRVECGNAMYLIQEALVSGIVLTQTQLHSRTHHKVCSDKPQLREVV